MAWFMIGNWNVQFTRCEPQNAVFQDPKKGEAFTKEDIETWAKELQSSLIEAGWTSAKCANIVWHRQDEFVDEYWTVDINT
jgi:hypothetical protein